MSYIVIFAKFPESDSEYPVGCFRTDLSPGDEVLIRISDRSLKPGLVLSVEYLNWNCKAFIECKVSESSLNSKGFLEPPSNSPVHIGLATHEALASLLSRNGWIRTKKTNVHEFVFIYSNKTQAARILLRRNGIDLQILEERIEDLPVALDEFSTSINNGRLVRHFFSHTSFNLYEGVFRFSKSFQEGTDDYDRFFKSVGSKDKVAVGRRWLADDADSFYTISDGTDGGNRYMG